MHRTRTRPKRAEEMEDEQASIYWVISGVIRCRQPILRLAAAVDDEGIARCDIIMAPDMVRVLPRPRDPFQGWRYLDPARMRRSISGMPAVHRAGRRSIIAEELARLGLL